MTTEKLDFDLIYLGHSSEPGGGHLATFNDVAIARAEDEEPLMLSNEAELFCTLIVLHGMLPSNAYLQAFTKEVDGDVIRPDLPSYSARRLLGTIEVKERIKELRAEVVEWGKTSFEELEMNLRSIALSPDAKHSDRIAASKTLAALRSFGVQEGGIGGTIVLQLPFSPQNLTPIEGRVIKELDTDVTP